MLIPGVQAAKPQKVTLMVDDVPVAQVLQALAEQEKLNLVVSPDVSGTVSLHLTDVPWKQALQTVVKSAGLITRQEGNILSVHSIAWQNNNIARQEAEQARAQANLPLENRSITLQYADAGELAKAGEKLLSAKGSMTVDKRTNRLLLRDNKTALSALEQWVAQMDLPVGQVELSAHIVTINEKSLRELGVKWTLADAQHAGGVGQVTTLGSDLSVATATTHVGFNIGASTDACWILSFPRSNKNSNWILSPVRVCWPHIFSLPALNRGAKFHIRFPAGKVARRRWNLKRPSWGWRSRPRCYKKAASG